MNPAAKAIIKIARIILTTIFLDFSFQFANALHYTAGRKRKKRESCLSTVSGYGSVAVVDRSGVAVLVDPDVIAVLVLVHERPAPELHVHVPGLH